MTRRVLAVTCADSNYFPLLKDMLLSFYALHDSSPIDLAVLDLGLSDADRRWLSTYTDKIIDPGLHFGLSETEVPLPQRAFLVRPFLPQYIPGYDLYLWIDGDIWFQSFDGVAAFLDGAERHGMAIAHERTPHYRFQSWLFLWTAKHFLLGYGPIDGPRLLVKPHLNAGLFAIAANAPHWGAWARRYEAAIRRTGKVTPHDQFALNQAIHHDGIETAIVPPVGNWICARGTPMWDDANQRFCEPGAPHRPISAMHLAGPAKKLTYTVRRTGGGSFDAKLRYGARPGSEPVPIGMKAVS